MRSELQRAGTIPIQRLTMKKAIQIFSRSLLVLFSAISLFAQSSPNLRFNGHTLGETADTFFATATISEFKALTKDYCKTLLDDPSTMKNYEAAKGAVNKKEFFLSYVSDCQQVMAALRGENASIGARYAYILSGEPVEVETQITVSFTLSH
jgi:hypothetical protein